jgi:hypothetical protein
MRAEMGCIQLTSVQLDWSDHKNVACPETQNNRAVESCRLGYDAHSVQFISEPVSCSLETLSLFHVFVTVDLTGLEIIV